MNAKGKQSAINPNRQFFNRPSLYRMWLGQKEEKESGGNLWRSARMDRRGKFARGEVCHSYVINCPVELGRDSNWIDYRYALGRTGGGDGGGGGGDGAGDFIRFPTRSGPENRRRDWKISHGNYGRLLQLYTPKMSGTPPEIYTYVAYIDAYMKARPAIVSICDSLHDHFIYSRIINARPIHADSQ